MRSAIMLKVTFIADALLAVGFGLFSWADPLGTFGSIVAVGADDEVALSALRGMSTLYVIVGAACGAAATLPFTLATRFGAVMALRHAWVGLQGVVDREASWLVGDPWPDIVIHAVFFVSYAAALLLARRQGTAGQAPAA